MICGGVQMIDTNLQKDQSHKFVRREHEDNENRVNLFLEWINNTNT